MQRLFALTEHILPATEEQARWFNRRQTASVAGGYARSEGTAPILTDQVVPVAMMRRLLDQGKTCGFVDATQKPTHR
jgi:hypothetical protein